MKEIDEMNYYGQGAKENLNEDDYKNELKRLEAEKKAREKYESDEIIKADLEKKEEIKKQAEKDAREKEKEGRQKRIEARQKVLKDEEAERKRIKDEREKAIAKFDTLETEDMLKVLNDGDDMQIYYNQMFKDGYMSYRNDQRINKAFDEIKPFSLDVSDEELEKADVLFRMLFSDIAEFEKPFIYFINNNNIPDDPNRQDDMIAANFVYDNISVQEIIDEKINDKGIDVSPEKTMRLQKFYVLNKIKDIYGMVNTFVGEDVKKLKTLDPEKNKETIAFINKELDEKLKYYGDDIKYRGFVAEQNTSGKMEVLRPAEDYTRDARSRKRWLDKHPENTEVNYIYDEVRYQLAFAKSFSEQVMHDQEFPYSIRQNRKPSSLNRAKYELREIRAAFEVQAEKVHDYDLKDFNKAMAFLCDYEAGDFMKLMREKPHIANLVDVVMNGPMTRLEYGETQEEIYNKLKKANPDTLKSYIRFVEGVAAQVEAEYAKQKFAAEGYPKEKEEEVKRKCVDAADNFYSYNNSLKPANLQAFDKYCRKRVSRAFDKEDNGNILSDMKVITNEVSALQRGWSFKETFIFAMVHSVYKKTRELYYNKSRQKYGNQYNEIADIEYKLEQAETAVERRQQLVKFENFIRKNIDDKELVAPTMDYRLEYDEVRENFDNGYSDAVKADLKKVENDPAKLAQEMVKMKTVAYDTDNNNVHNEIFKDYIKGLDKNKKTELQKAIYNERHNQMLKRAENVSKYSEEIYKRDELATFKENRTIHDDVYAQIGRIVSENDGVTAADDLEGLFEDKLADDVKKKITDDFTEKNIKSKAFKIGDEEYPDFSHYQMELAKKIDNNKADHGFKVVKAPDGGFNIRYDKEIVEIKKDLMEKTDAQFGDLEVELARIRSTMNSYIMRINNDEFTKIHSGSGDMYYDMYSLATYDSGFSVSSYIDTLKNVAKKVDGYIKDAKDGDKPGEVEFFEEIKAFTNKSLGILKPENYPDVNFYTLTRNLKRDVEVTKVLWENREEGNKWEPKPSEYVKEKQKNAVDSKEEQFYKAIAKTPSRKMFDEDKGYDDIRLKPSRIYEMCEKYFNALVAIDGNDVSKESKEYQEFYYSLKDLKENFRGKEVSQIDGSNVTLDCILDLDTTIKAYLKSNDTSKNAPLRKNVADQINRNYLYVKHGFDWDNNVAMFEEWTKNDRDIKKAINKLPDEAKQKRQARIDAEEKAKEDAKKAEKEAEETKKKLNDELKKINVKERDIKNQLKAADKQIEEANSQIGTSNKNIAWAKTHNRPDRVADNEKLINESNAKIKAAEQKKADLNKQLAGIDKERKDARKKFVVKEIKEEKPKLRRQAVKDAMMKVAKKNDPVKKVDEKKVVPPVEKEVPKKGKKANAHDGNNMIIDENVNNNIINDKKDNIIEINEKENIINTNVIKTDIINEIHKKDNIIKDNKKKNDIIELDDDLNDNVKKNTEKPSAKKAPKAKKGKLEVSYKSYIMLHTGEHAGKNHKEKVNNFAKVIAAYMLSASKKKFSVSMIHDFVDVMKENLLLNDISEDKLNEYLASPKEATKGALKVVGDLYNVTGNQGEYCREMMQLYNSMMSDEGRSAEYKDLKKCIKRVAFLNDKEFSSEQDKADSFSHVSFLLAFGIAKYMKGKKSVRTFEGGRERFDNALDAAAILTKYAPSSKKRIDKLVDRINEVRKDKKNPVSLDNYGVDRAIAAHNAREAAKKAKKGGKEEFSAIDAHWQAEIDALKNANENAGKKADARQTINRK